MVGEGGDEGRAVPAGAECVGFGGVRRDLRVEVPAGVADLDAEAAGGRVEDEREPEATAERRTLSR
ncbi:hypothetical protein GCM10009549_01690 [Streptomyces thermoalcalitolerans]|uniref:Uncharacterized protein n=1 Tax=Streptomyces thermoalcalitolerans TaxID=65605 RepID=A0ABP3YQD4_9ACTN